MQPYGLLMVSSHRLGSDEKNFNQCLTGTAVARDTTLKKAYKRTNGVLLRELASWIHFSSNIQIYGVHSNMQIQKYSKSHQKWYIVYLWCKYFNKIEFECWFVAQQKFLRVLKLL